MADSPTNDFKPGDDSWNLLRKILARLKAILAATEVPASVTLGASDIEIGAVEIKNATDDTRAVVKTSDPLAGDAGIVVRNIPGAAAQPVSGPLTNVELRATPVPVDIGTVTLGASDLEVGAVEIKNATTDDRVSVSVAGAMKVDGSAVTQPVSVASVALTPSAPSQATVGVASATAVSASARKGLILINTSTTATISLGFGVAAVLNSGVTLPPNSVLNMDEFSFYAGAIAAIASAAATNLSIQEFV